MGLFSQDCVACGHPALMEQATNDVNQWMAQVVSIAPDGELHVGEYDGYGRVGSAEYAIGYEATVWHVACWEVAGKPMEYSGGSRNSRDQGWFFDDGAHDMVDPRVSKEVSQ